MSQNVNLIANFISINLNFGDGAIVGTFESPKTGDRFKAKGKMIEGREFVPGVPYQLYGRITNYTNKRTGETEKQFQFFYYKIVEPHSFDGVRRYIRRYAKGCGLGDATIRKIFDKYGQNTLPVLRGEHEKLAYEFSLNPEKLAKASDILNRLARLEDTRIELIELFSNYGFSLDTVDECINRWEARAPEVIRTNPWRLLIDRISGCGFLRVDQLYMGLGKDPHNIERHMFAIWFVLRSDSSGHTWVNSQYVISQYTAKISENLPNPGKAIDEGIRKGWLRKHRDQNNQVWLAEAGKAANEDVVCKRIEEILNASTLAEPELIEQAD